MPNALRPEPQWPALSAIYGGTFDPPHVGHRQAVEGLFRVPGVGRVVVIPAAQQPLKNATTDSAHRLAMTKLCFEGLRNVVVDDREMRRSGPSYTIDTIRELKREAGAGEIAFVCGADQIESLPKWSRYEELIAECHWLALERKPDGEDRIARAMAEYVAQGLAETAGERRWRWKRGGTFVRACPTDARELSSTDVRRLFSLAREGAASEAETLLTTTVYAYLKANRLYGT